MLSVALAGMQRTAGPGFQHGHRCSDMQVPKWAEATDAAPGSSALQNGDAASKGPKEGAGKPASAPAKSAEAAEFRALDCEGVKGYLAARPALAALLGPAEDAASWQVPSLNLVSDSARWPCRVHAARMPRWALAQRQGGSTAQRSRGGLGGIGGGGTSQACKCAGC